MKKHEVGLSILKAMDVLIREELGSRYETESIEAWGYAVRGSALLNAITKENLIRSREFYEKAVKLDPNYADAWMDLAWTYFMEATFGWSKSPAEANKKIYRTRKKVI
jgi:hypothetical protein